MKHLLSAALVALLFFTACSNEHKIDEMSKGQSVAGADTTGPASITSVDTAGTAAPDTTTTP